MELFLTKQRRPMVIEKEGNCHWASTKNSLKYIQRYPLEIVNRVSGTEMAHMALNKSKTEE